MEWDEGYVNPPLITNSAQIAATTPVLGYRRESVLNQSYEHQLALNRLNQYGIASNPNLSIVSPQRMMPYKASTQNQIFQAQVPVSTPMNTIPYSNTDDKNMVAVGKQSSRLNQLGSMITKSHAICLLVGLMICGIPLAVLTTLYYLKSTSTATTNDTSGSTVSTVPILPSQCYLYTNNYDATRLSTNPSCCTCYSDSSLNGWYRFSGNAGTRLVTTPFYSVNGCGTSYPGWWNGTYPMTVGATSIGNVCFYVSNTCGNPVSPISVTNCSGYYVFYLQPALSCFYRYCTTF